MPPWVLTVTGLVVGLAAAGAAASGWWGPALVGWWANRVLDGLDGEIARAQGRASRLGGLLDLSADVAVYAALPLGVATGIDTIEAWQAAAALLAACYLNITTVTVLGGFAQDSDVDRVALPVGLVEGGETIVLYSLVLVGGSWRVELLAVSAALIALGAVIRLVTTVRPGSLG
ncbi:MAG: CDP-alcohol phosphatidyltransferase family protein [Acidimicrobiales bacterium]